MTRYPLLLALVLTIAPLAATAAAEPGVDHSHVPGGQRFYTAAAGESFAGYPAVFDAGVTSANGARSQRIMLGYNSAQDLPLEMGTRVKQSTDGGATWAPFAHDDGAVQIANLFRLPNAAGDLVTIDFQDLDVTDPNCTVQSVCRSKFNRRILTTTGWTDALEATVSFSEPIAWARFGQSPLVLGDGKTLLAPMYGIYNAGVRPFAVVVKSQDEGVTWTEVAQLATGAGWAEPHLSPTSDGGLLAVLRKDENMRGPVPANLALYSRKAPDQSGTGWGAAVRLTSETGNSPTVKMLGNGAIALASGRPDSLLRFSFDGKGTSWSPPSTLYQNFPTTGGDPDGWYTPTGPAARPLRHLGSSGTVGVMPVGGNRLLAVGDNCASGWGCPNDSTVSGYTVDKVNALWKSWVEVDTDQWGKVDLTTMFQRGELTVVNSPMTRYGDCAGNVNYCRQSLAAYAFDGDPKADSSLVTADRSVTLRLPRPMAVAALGLHAHLQGGTDVRIETSADGTTWTTPARGARDGIVRPFTAPVTAQFLRISDPNPITDSTAAFLHEMELYTTAVGFEHDYPGQAPRGNGWQAASTLATVVSQTSVPAADRISARFLRIKDDSASAIGSAMWTHTASTAVTAEFRFRGYGSTNKGMLFSIKGLNGTTAATPYGFWLSSAGKFHWADYSLTSPWGAPLNATAISLSAWHTVKLEATMSQVTLTVDGTPMATKPLSQPATTMTGLGLGSNGTSTTGDDWLFDDVAYTS
jgi:hypothetical protein